MLFSTQHKPNVVSQGLSSLTLHTTSLSRFKIIPITKAFKLNYMRLNRFKGVSTHDEVVVKVS